MKFRFVFSIILFCTGFSFSFAQNNQRLFADADAAQRYVVWIRKAIEEERWDEARAAVDRAVEFGNVSSDISYLAAYVCSETGGSRPSIVKFLDTSIEVNRWTHYNENEALVLKAEQLVNMRRYESALAVLGRIREGVTDGLSADAAMLRLKAFKGLAVFTGGASELAGFRSLMNTTMNRFSRDPRPARIFLEYARYAKPEFAPAASGATTQLAAGDQQVLDLVLRRLPVLVELDPELAWMAAPFIRNADDARRLVASYRAGGLSKNNEQYSPNPNAVPVALNLGLISDFQAVEEVFFEWMSYSEASAFSIVEFEAVTETYRFLRSEEGRDVFTQTLLSLNSIMLRDADHDGITDTIVSYANGDIISFSMDKNQENVFDFKIDFSAGVPVASELALAASSSQVKVKWERYPFVLTAELPNERFNFRPADFQFAPISFIVLGGSKALAGINYPVLANHADLTRRTLVSFCSSILRRSVEFESAMEIINLEKGIPMRAIEFIGRNIISIAEFERGVPVIQYIDLDLDGRMETIRRFHRPGPNYPWPDSGERFDYRKLIASSESDWAGEGRYKTGEVYQQDGSVVYYWDMDGDGTMDHSETQR